jgi:hypothetical protein
MHDEIKDFISWRMDKEAKALGLSEIQQQQYDKFRTRFLETMEKTIETRVEFHKRAFSSLENETPDLSAMATEAKERAEMISGSISESLTLFSDFFNSLDPAQKKTMTDKIKERINDHKNNFPCNDKEI